MGVDRSFEPIARPAVPALDAILGEPTNLGLYYGHDGWFQAEVRLEGKNAFEVDNKAVRAIFQEYRADPENPSGEMLEEAAVLSTQAEYGLDKQRLRIETAHRLHIHDDVNELSAERRDGYSWYNAGPREALDRYAEWSVSHPPA